MRSEVSQREPIFAWRNGSHVYKTMRNNENLNKMKSGLPPSVLMTMIVGNGSNGTEYGPDHIARALIKVNPTNTDRSYVIPAPLFDPKLKSNPYKSLSENIEQEPMSTRMLLLAGDLAAVAPSIDADLKKHGENLRVLWISRKTGLAHSRETRPEKWKIPTGTSVMEKSPTDNLKRQRQSFDANIDNNSTFSASSSSVSSSKAVRDRSSDSSSTRRKRVQYASQEDILAHSKRYPLSALLGQEGTIKYWEAQSLDENGYKAEGARGSLANKGTLRYLPATSVMCIGQHFRPPSTYLQKLRHPLLTPKVRDELGRGPLDRQPVESFPSLPSSASALTAGSVRERHGTPFAPSPVTVVHDRKDLAQRFSGIEGEDDERTVERTILSAIGPKQRIGFEEEQGLSEEMKQDWLAAKAAGVMVIPFGADDVIEFLPSNITTLESPKHSFLESSAAEGLESYDPLFGSEQASEELPLPISAAAMERSDPAHYRVSSVDRSRSLAYSNLEESIFSLSPDKSESTLTLPMPPESGLTPSPSSRVAHRSPLSRGSPEARGTSHSPSPVPLTGSPLAHRLRASPSNALQGARRPVGSEVLLDRSHLGTSQLRSPVGDVEIPTPSDATKLTQTPSMDLRAPSETKYEDAGAALEPDELEKMSNVSVPSGASIFRDTSTMYEHDERPFVQVYNPYQGPMNYPGDAIATLNQVSPLIPAMSARGKSLIEDEDLMSDEGIACIVRATQCIHQSFHSGLLMNPPSQVQSDTMPNSTPLTTPTSTIVREDDGQSTPGLEDIGQGSLSSSLGSLGGAESRSPSPTVRSSTSGRALPQQHPQISSPLAGTTTTTTSSPSLSRNRSTEVRGANVPGYAATAGKEKDSPMRRQPPSSLRGAERDQASIANEGGAVPGMQETSQASVWSTKSINSGELGTAVYHVVLDLEAISSMDIPCAGSSVTSRTTLRPGLRLDQVLSLLMTLPGPFISLDIVGYNPLRGDPEELASVQQSILSVIKLFSEGAMLQQLSHEQLPPPPSDVLAASLEANLASRYADYKTEMDQFSPYSQESPGTNLLRSSTDALHLSPQHARTISGKSKRIRHSGGSSISSAYPIRLYRSMSQALPQGQDYLDFGAQAPSLVSPALPTGAGEASSQVLHQHTGTTIERIGPQLYTEITPRSRPVESPSIQPYETSEMGTPSGRTVRYDTDSSSRYQDVLGDVVLQSVTPFLSPITGMETPEALDRLDFYSSRPLSVASPADDVEITHSIYCDPAPRSHLSRRSSSLIDSFDPLVRTETVMPDTSFEMVSVETPTLQTPGSISSERESEGEERIPEETSAYSVITPSPLVDSRQRMHARSRSRGRLSRDRSRDRVSTGPRMEELTASESGIGSREQPPSSVGTDGSMFRSTYVSPYVSGVTTTYGTQIPTLSLPHRGMPDVTDSVRPPPASEPPVATASPAGPLAPGVRSSSPASRGMQEVLLTSPTVSSRTAEMQIPSVPRQEARATTTAERPSELVEGLVEEVADVEEGEVVPQRRVVGAIPSESTAVGDERARLRRAYSSTDAELYSAWRRMRAGEGAAGELGGAGYPSMEPISEYGEGLGVGADRGLSTTSRYRRGPVPGVREEGALEDVGKQKSGLPSGSDATEAGLEGRVSAARGGFGDRELHISGRRRGPRAESISSASKAEDRTGAFAFGSNRDLEAWTMRKEFIRRSNHVRHGSIEFQPKPRLAAAHLSFGVLAQPRVETTEGGKNVIVRSNLPGQTVASTVAPVKVSLPVENAAALAIAMRGKIERLPFASIMPSRTALEMPPEIEVNRIPPTPTSDVSSVP